MSNIICATGCDVSEQCTTALPITDRQRGERDENQLDSQDKVD